MASNVVSDNFETSGGGVPQLGGTGATTCKAWVNFNGTGTVAIRDSFNVSSITDNGTGNYTVHYSTAFANTDYSVSSSMAFEVSGNYTDGAIATLDASTTSTRFATGNASSTLIDTYHNSIQVFA